MQRTSVLCMMQGKADTAEWRDCFVALAMTRRTLARHGGAGERGWLSPAGRAAFSRGAGDARNRQLTNMCGGCILWAGKECRRCCGGLILSAITATGLSGQ